jgi:diketogulonate reductase-like aldo/keto reductase
MEMIEAHGTAIPAIGFGTGALKGEPGRAAIVEALSIGYRHLDTARTYGNEVMVGEAIRASGLKRGEVFLTTKVWPDRLSESEMLKSVEESLTALSVDQVDLFMIHWANPHLSMPDMIRALNGVKKRGLTRHIGVSNFTGQLLADAWHVTESPIIANQCEYHPMIDQRSVLEACRALGTILVAYMPLGRRQALEIPVLSEIGRRLNRSTAQVILRWHVQQHGVAAIPNSANSKRMRENIAVFDFELSDADMSAISALAGPDGRLSPFPRVRQADGTFKDFQHFAPDWNA